MAILEIEGRRVEVDDSFKNLSPEQQAATVDEIAASMNIEPGSEQGTVSNLMSFVNRGIARGAGGLVDLINPFDQPHALNPFPEGTGSAVEGLGRAMTAIGAPPAERDPETFLEGLAAGTGEAAAAFGPAVGALRTLSLSTNPTVAAVADDALNAMLTRAGATAEVAAGGIAGGAGELAQQAGAGPVVETLARTVSPIAVFAGAPAATRLAARGSASVATGVPFIGRAVQAGANQIREVRRALTPQTRAGARIGAANRLRDLVGGEERAAELARRIEAGDEFGLSPARQTEDPVLLGLERRAKVEDPLLREKLDLREMQSREMAGVAIRDLGGDVQTAQTRFQRRIDEFGERMQDRIDQAINKATERVEGVGPKISETQASMNVVDRVKTALSEELLEENRLWSAVPQDQTVAVDVSRTVARDFIDSTPRALQRDIPQEARTLLLDAGGFGDRETVAEIHGLYSRLRQISREASADLAPNRNRARIANEIADAILMDLDAVDPTTELGRSINDARAFSRALHEKFDTGAVGKMLNQNKQGAETLFPGAALRRTVRAGPEGVAAEASITGAAPQAREDMTEYLRGQFLDNAISPVGEFTPKVAARWMRNNRELLNKFPELKKEINGALTSRKNADVFAARASARQALVESESATARFALAPPEKAALTIIGSRDPAKAARSIMATARRDPTEFSEQGVKGAMTDYLISGGTRADGLLAGDKLSNLMKDTRIRAALKQVFTPKELGRLDRITRAVSKLDPAKEMSVAAVLDNPANRMLEFAVTTLAARHGAQLGAGTSGASLKTAAAASERAKAALQNLTNAKAREMLMDAVEDPQLMKALLSTPRSYDISPEIRSKIAPYLIGGVSTVDLEQEQEEGQP